MRVVPIVVIKVLKKPSDYDGVLLQDSRGFDSSDRRWLIYLINATVNTLLLLPQFTLELLGNGPDGAEKSRPRRGAGRVGAQ